MPSRRQMLNQGMRGAMPSLLVLCVVVQFLPVAGAQAQGSVESDFVATLNAERAAAGKSPLAVNSCLTTAAYLHSKDMAEQGYFSHTSLDGRTFDQRIVAAGYTSYFALAENIAYASGAPDAARVFGMWKNSSGHYANMIGNFTDAGLGVYSKNGLTYYTLDLARSRSATPPQVPEFPFPAVFFLLFALTSALGLVSVRSASDLIAE